MKMPLTEQTLIFFRMTDMTRMLRVFQAQQAAQALGSGAHDALGAGALPHGSQTTGPGPSGCQANNTEISFPKNKVLDLNISDTMLQPDGSSTPLPPSPKSVSQAKSTPLPTSPQSGSMEAVQVPEYLHKFFSQILKDWNNHFPYSHDACLVPFITKDQTKYSLNWDRATAKNISVIMLRSDQEGKKSPEHSPNKL
jgi:hypothetical protein